MKSFMKVIGGTLLGVAIFAALILIVVLLFTYGSKVAFKIEPFINWLAAILFLIDLIALPFVIPKATRQAVGVVLLLSSFVFGIATWLYGFAVTLALWGIGALVIGIFIGGVGVVPIGLLAAGFHQRWGIFFGLLANLILTLVTRVGGALLAESGENDTPALIYDNVIEGEVQAVHETSDRKWDDIK